MNSFIDSLPEAWQQPTTELFAQLGVSSPVLGAVTPDNLYPTDVYSLSADGWTNWDGGANTYGMFTDHLEYLGLTPSEIASATLTREDMTNYYTIDNSNVNDLAALSNQLLLALGIAPSNVSTDAVAATATTPDTFAELLSQSAADFSTLEADLQVLSADLSAELFSALGIPDLFLP